MSVNITTATATNVGLAKGIQITVNNGFTGTIVTSAGGSTQYGTPASTIGTVTNPAVGQSFRYGGLHTQGPITITPSGVGDLTITKINNLV